MRETGWRLLAGLGLMLLAAGTSLPAQAPGDASGGRTLVVPFAQDRFDPRVGWLGEGTAIGLTAALAGRGVAVVGRDERLAAFERLQLPSSSALTRATIIKVAELVGAARVIVGRVSASATDVTIDAQTLQVDTARLDPAVHHVSPIGGLLDGFEALARFSAPQAVRAGGRRLAPSVQAFELYVRGLTGGSEELQERYLAQAVEQAPDYVDARLALWDVQSARGAHDQAVATLKGVAADDPQAFDAGIRSAASLVQLRRYDEAYASLKVLASVTPSAVVSNLMGIVQLRRPASPQAGRATYFFHEAAELEPADADYCFNLGYAYWLDKDATAAAYWLREAVRRDPTDGDAHFVLAAALGADSAGPEADRERELARRLSERWEAATSATVPRGLERVKDRLSVSAQRVDSVVQEGVQRDQRETSAFHLEAARRAFEAGRDPETIREAQRALYLTPYDAAAHLLLGRALARSGLLQEAVDALKVAIWSSETATAHVALGDVLLRLRDLDGAGRAADRALVLDPASAEATALAARVRAARVGA
jgi:tetratricopeptide (TPR) repeat protein